LIVWCECLQDTCIIQQPSLNTSNVLASRCTGRKGTTIDAKLVLKIGDFIILGEYGSSLIAWASIDGMELDWSCILLWAEYTDVDTIALVVQKNLAKVVDSIWDFFLTI
jgi:hypothetical protein